MLGVFELKQSTTNIFGGQLLSQNYKYYNSRHHGAKVVSRQKGLGEAGNSAHDVPQRQVSKSHNSTHSEDEEISIILMEEAVTE